MRSENCSGMRKYKSPSHKLEPSENSAVVTETAINVREVEAVMTMMRRKDGGKAVF